jgi:FMN phosphatase YigB (HAD superfamily)
MVFDLGGVLLDWDPRHLYRKLIPDPIEMEWFLANVCTWQWHDPHDRGASTAPSCAVLARRWPAYAGLIWAWWDALTNMEAETYPKRRRRYEFLSWFAGTVVSGFEGVAKPDPQIYEVLLGRFDLDPETTLFVDDREVNVVAAAHVGMEAYLYTGPEPVLARLGLVRG